MRGDCTRRSFLVHAAGTLAVPMLLGACRRSANSGDETVNAELAELNLDEVPDAASFRPPLPKVEPIIRVRVARHHTSPPTLRIGQSQQWLRVSATGPTRAGRGVALQGPLVVSRESSGWSIVDVNGFSTALDPTAEVEIAPADTADGTATDSMPLLTVQEVSTNGASPSASGNPQQFPGGLRLVHRHDLKSAAPNAYDLINDVPIEQYLPGVLMGELFRTWQLNTFAAQAVAARSFAATEAAVFAGKRHYDVTNTASSQMYLGSVDARSGSRAHEAVNMTRGLVLGYEGLLVSGYYSSCCGGIAASAVDAIGPNPVNNVAPLQGRPEHDVCTDAPVYQWTAEQSIEQLTRRLIAFGKERRIKDLISFTRLEAIDVIAENAHGRPTKVRVMDDRQTAVEMSAENFRRAANHSAPGMNPPEKPLRSSNLRATFARDAVVMEGFGFGHGVGLCQYGAEALAKSGKQFHDILLWYYPGVELVQAYG